MKLHKRTAKSIADLMIGHYENPMESPDEFLEDEDEARYVDDLLLEYHNMYHNDLLDFRQDILKKVAKMMDVKIKIL